MLLKAQLVELYDRYRTALLNKKYYGAKLSEYKRMNMGMEIIVAIGATGSGLAGWALWKSDAGQILWAFIAGAASFLSIVKPIWGLSNEIQRYTELYTGYAAISIQLRNIVADVKMKHTFDAEEEYRDVLRMSVELGSRDDPNPNRKMLARLQNEVNREVPPETLWMP